MATSLKKAAKGNLPSRWDESIKDDLFPIPKKSATVRLYNHIVTVKQHWVEFDNEQGERKVFGELCLNWDPAEEKVVDGKCPMCSEGMLAVEHHYAYLIPRAMQKKGITTVHPVRLTSKLASDIVKLSEAVYPDQEDAPDATDIKGGFDILLSQEQKRGRTSYSALHGAKTPLTKAEREAFKEYIAEHDVATLAKPSTPRAAIVDKLKRLKVIEGGKSTKNTKRDQVPDDDELDDDEEDTKVSAKAGKTSNKARRDDDEDEDDEDDEPKKPAAGKKASSKKPVASDDDEDEDEDDEPKKPAAGKTKPKAGKPSAKKPSLEDDDEDEDDKPKGRTQSYAKVDDDDEPDDDDDEDEDEDDED